MGQTFILRIFILNIERRKKVLSFSKEGKVFDKITFKSQVVTHRQL